MDKIQERQLPEFKVELLQHFSQLGNSCRWQEKLSWATSSPWAICCAGLFKMVLKSLRGWALYVVFDVHCVMQ